MTYKDTGANDVGHKIKILEKELLTPNLGESVDLQVLQVLIIAPLQDFSQSSPAKRGEKASFIANLDLSIACMGLHLGFRVAPGRVVFGRVDLGVVAARVSFSEVATLADEVALVVSNLRFLLVGHEVEVVVPKVLFIRVLELGGVVITQILSNGVTMRNDT